jgi:hypothetical protein
MMSMPRYVYLCQFILCGREGIVLDERTPRYVYILCLCVSCTYSRLVFSNTLCAMLLGTQTQAHTPNRCIYIIYVYI